MNERDSLRQTVRGRGRAVAAMATAGLRADPWRTFGSTILDIVTGIARPLLAVGTGLVVDAVANPGRATSSLAVGVAVLASSASALLILSVISGRLRLRLEENVAHHVEVHVMKMVTGLPGTAHHENPAHLHRIDRLLEESWLVAQAVPAIIMALETIVRFGFTVALLARIDSRLAFLPLACIPVVFAGVVAERIRLRALEARSETVRVGHELFWIAGRTDAAAELRVLGAGRNLLVRHTDARELMSHDELRHRLRGAWRLALGRAGFATAFGVGLLVLSDQAAAGRVSVGQLVTAIGLSGQIIGQAAAVSGRLNWMNYALSGVRHYVWLLDYEDRHGAMSAHPMDAPDRLTDGIHFEQVDFTYPGTDQPVLRGLDLHLPAGSVVAIVGDNGAGKTTLIKLLLRFYEPTTGRITIDGVPLADIDIEKWRAVTTAALQDHTRPQVLVGEAIGMGDLARIDDDDAVATASARSGADAVVDDIPGGLNAQLGLEWPAGTDLSGGQWQRLAVGRSAMREQPIVLILDEPTSALDPAAEHALFEHYAGRGADGGRRQRGAVTLVISHRLSTVRMADHIVVLADGQVAEAGSHAALLAAGGRYAELFRMQAAGYR